MTTDVDAFFSENDYDGEKLDSFKFPNVGDAAGGTICKQPKVVELDSAFGKGKEQKLLLVLEHEGIRKNLWVKGQMASAIKEAFSKAGAPGLAEGGKLGVVFKSTKDTGKGQPMKVFEAKYEPPAPRQAAVDDFFAGESPSTPEPAAAGVAASDLF